MDSEIAKKPKVSVYISTHNRLERLKRAIRSVLSQDYENIELLICDDASIDGTQEYIMSLCREDSRVRYFRNNVNKGACATRNLGIFNASGYFITGLDDDDEFMPNRLSTFVSNWDDKYSFLSCDFYDCYNNIKRRSHYKRKNKELCYNYKDLLFDNIASNQVFTLTERMREINGFDVSVKRLQDWDTWLRLAHRFGIFKVLPEITYIMHHDHSPHEQRVSKTYPFALALNELSQRNLNLYNNDEKKFVDYLVSLENKKGKLLDSVIWSIKRKHAKYSIKYLQQFFTKNNQR